MRSLWGLWEIYEAHRQIRSKKTTSQHLDMSWCCEVISITNGFVYEVYEPHRQIRASGGVTGGFGWVQTHPLSKKPPMRFFRKLQNLSWISGKWNIILDTIIDHCCFSESEDLFSGLKTLCSIVKIPYCEKAICFPWMPETFSWKKLWKSVNKVLDRDGNHSPAEWHHNNFLYITVITTFSDIWNYFLDW